jgi:putative endonuclease
LFQSPLVVVPANAGTHLTAFEVNEETMSTGTFCVYILASRRNGTLYIGISNRLRTRLEQHRAGRGSEFVRKYSVHRLVYVETFTLPQEAIAREKQLKNWRRDWKIQLIEEQNPNWRDLSHLL